MARFAIPNRVKPLKTIFDNLGYHCCSRTIRCDEMEGDCRADAECHAGDSEDNTIVVDNDSHHARSYLHQGCLHRKVWPTGRSVGW